MKKVITFLDEQVLWRILRFLLHVYAASVYRIIRFLGPKGVKFYFYTNRTLKLRNIGDSYNAKEPCLPRGRNEFRYVVTKSGEMLYNDAYQVCVSLGYAAQMIWAADSRYLIWVNLF